MHHVNLLSRIILQKKYGVFDSRELILYFKFMYLKEQKMEM